jgi:fido (protein-threonine AMPylation protein)
MLTEDFMRTLHKQMFGDVWRWAGTFRTTERNIGVQAYRIGMELAGLLGDSRYWIEHETLPPEEIAIRFHHLAGRYSPISEWQRSSCATGG